MAQYLMSVWHDDVYEDNDFDDPDTQRLFAQVDAVNKAMESAGVWVFGGGLQPQHHRDHPPCGRWTGVDDRRPLRGVEGADGWLLGDRGRRSRCRPRLGGQGGRRVRRAGRAPTVPERLNAECGLVRPDGAAIGADELARVFTREVGRCTATLIRILGDIDLAQDAVAEAFAVATERWPTTGMPANPGAWITTTARNRAFDRLRRESTRTNRYIAAYRLADTDMTDDPLPGDTAGHHDDDRDRLDLDEFADVIPDDQLRLMFLCCHPALSPDAQVALTLRLLGGLDTTRDRTRLRRARGDHRPADRAGQAQVARQPCELPDPAGGGTPRPARRGARRHLPHLHGGPHRDQRRPARRAPISRRRPSVSVGCSSS